MRKSFMPCPFTGPKMFCAGPNILCQPKNLTAFSASSKTFVLAQKTILLTANHLFVWHKMFETATICKYIFGLAQKSWISTKLFGTCKRTRHKFILVHFIAFTEFFEGYFICEKISALFMATRQSCKILDFLWLK